MRNLPLHAQHQTLGARFVSVADWEIPAHYGDWKAEHHAVRHGAGLMDLSYRGRIKISGPDRGKFLQGLITNDALKLQEGEGLYATILNPKGRMLADLKLYCQPEAFLLEMDRELTGDTLGLLNRYRLVSKVQVEDVTDPLAQLAIHGPSAASLLQEVLGQSDFPVRDYAWIEVPWEGKTVQVVRSPDSGEEGYDLMIQGGSPAGLWSAFLKAGGGKQIRPIGREALECLRIEAGLPRYGVDMDEQTFPPEAGLEDRAISYSKGCYIGQETIARIRTYGQVRRQLVGLILEDRTSSAPLPTRGEKVTLEDEEVGFVTSAVYSPVLEGPVALAYLQKKVFAPDLKVRVACAGDTSGNASTAARAITLPFYRRDT